MHDRCHSAFRALTGRKTYQAIIATAVAGLLSSCESSQSTTDELLIVQYSVNIRAGETIEDVSLLKEGSRADAESADILASITPALPDGLSFNISTARMNGITNSTGSSEHTIAIEQADILTTHKVAIHIDNPLPEAFEFLTAGFNAETIVPHAELPVRMAIAKDGRIFYAELQTGRIRVFHPDSGLLNSPFAHLDITSGEERGLLGLALDPQFDQNGYVYVHATFANNDGTEHAKILRFSAVDNQGVNATVLVDELPVADLHNGGDIIFDKSGHIFIGRGDINSAALAQTEGSTAGRILRYTKDGGIPTDNPLPGNPEWARGLRNTFALALHPVTGELFGADAGPANNDKLQFLKAGKNFLWGMEEEPQGSNIGYTIRVWHEVITPTALLFHSGEGGFSDYENQLLLSSYNEEDIRVIHLTGNFYADFVREETFAVLRETGIENKPLHLAEGPDGSLYISTFKAIHKITSSK